VAHVSDSLLRCACARAHGKLISLDVSHERKGNKPRTRKKNEAISVTLPVLLRVLRDNQATLKRVRFNILWLKYSEDPFLGFAPEFSHYRVNVDDLQTIAKAAPGVQLEAGLDCVVSDHAFSIQVDDEEGTMSPISETYDTLMAALRREAPFGDVKLHAVALSYFFLEDKRNESITDYRAAMEAANTAKDAQLQAIFQALGSHDSLAAISMYCNGEQALGDDARSGAFVDACAALPCLKKLDICGAGLEKGHPIQALTRLIASCGQLASLTIAPGGGFGGDDVFTGPDLPAFCAALRESALVELTLRLRGMMRRADASAFEDVAAGEVIVAAARASRRKMSLKVNERVLVKGG
jgi:hypothetical protein